MSSNQLPNDLSILIISVQQIGLFCRLVNRWFRWCGRFCFAALIVNVNHQILKGNQKTAQNLSTILSRCIFQQEDFTEMQAHFFNPGFPETIIYSHREESEWPNTWLRLVIFFRTSFRSTSIRYIWLDKIEIPNKVCANKGHVLILPIVSIPGQPPGTSAAIGLKNFKPFKVWQPAEFLLPLCLSLSTRGWLSARATRYFFGT